MRPTFKKILFSVTFFCIIQLITAAQFNNNDSIRVTGVVLEQDSATTLPYSRLSVKSRTFTSDEKGRFSVWALIGDIVQFSHIGYKDTYIQISDSLKHNNYIFGVFLSRDTIRLSEVIVVPRYKYLIRKAKTMPLVITPDEAYANNNIRISTQQALTQTPIRMDAEMNQRMVLQEHIWSTVYKTQIPPDNTFGVTTENMALMRLFIPEKEEKVKAARLQPLNKNELNLIIKIYEQKRQQEANNQ